MTPLPAWNGVTRKARQLTSLPGAGKAAMAVEWHPLRSWLPIGTAEGHFVPGVVLLFFDSDFLGFLWKDDIDIIIYTSKKKKKQERGPLKVP